MMNTDFEASFDSETEPCESDGVEGATMNATHAFGSGDSPSSGVFPFGVQSFSPHEIVRLN